MGQKMALKCSKGQRVSRLKIQNTMNTSASSVKDILDQAAAVSISSSIVKKASIIFINAMKIMITDLQKLLL